MQALEKCLWQNFKKKKVKLDRTAVSSIAPFLKDACLWYTCKYKHSRPLWWFSVGGRIKERSFMYQCPTAAVTDHHKFSGNRNSLLYSPGGQKSEISLTGLELQGHVPSRSCRGKCVLTSSISWVSTCHSCVMAFSSIFRLHLSSLPFPHDVFFSDLGPLAPLCQGPLWSHWVPLENAGQPPRLMTLNLIISSKSGLPWKVTYS